MTGYSSLDTNLAPPAPQDLVCPLPFEIQRARAAPGHSWHWCGDPCFETTLLEPTFTTSKETVPFLWNAWWLWVRSWWLSWTGLVLFSWVNLTFVMTSHSHCRSTSVYRCLKENARLILDGLISLSWREQRLSRLLKVSWRNGPKQYCGRLSRLSNPHPKTHNNQFIQTQIMSSNPLRSASRAIAGRSDSI